MTDVTHTCFACGKKWLVSQPASQQWLVEKPMPSWLIIPTTVFEQLGPSPYCPACKVRWPVVGEHRSPRLSYVWMLVKLAYLILARRGVVMSAIQKTVGRNVYVDVLFSHLPLSPYHSYPDLIPPAYPTR